MCPANSLNVPTLEPAARWALDGWMVRSCSVALNPMVENIRTDFKH